MTHRLQAQFDEHVHQFPTVQFWIIEVRFNHQDVHDDIRTGRSPLDDPDATILTSLDKEHGMRCMPQQPSSSELDFSDFYLFLTVKKLERIQLADEDHFF
jgi:hypothetical protein